MPPTVRHNDAWSSEVVAGWVERVGHRTTRDGGEVPAAAAAPGIEATMVAMRKYADDPFRGAVERRVMTPDLTTSEMEAHAAREAMSRAGISPADVDVILTQTPVPEHLMVNGACVTHRLLELPERCLALGTEAACNAFAHHLTLAAALIDSGRARYVLSVHSSAITRTNDPREPQSAWWGDGAAAVVIGRVSTGRGLLAAIHNANGGSSEALVLGVPGRPWWEDGSITTYALDRTHTRLMLTTLADRAAQTIGEALDAANVSRRQVEFYASHQGTAWFTEVTAQVAGLHAANTLVTFPTTGNMNSVNIPFILARADRAGMLHDDAIVATFGGGLGETWSSAVLRWGP